MYDTHAQQTYESRRKRGNIWRLAIGLGCLVTPAMWAQGACPCQDPHDAQTPPGVVWQGALPSLTLPDVAHILAPVLWFSSDEPLLLEQRFGAIPSAHPWDRPASGAVVYYQPTELVLRGGEQVLEPAEQDAAFFEKVDHFILKYFFYYPEDRGLRPHLHDLEVVRVYVHLDRTEQGCYRVRASRISGLAHGVEWYTNILNLRSDTVFPVTILVEEGKHASAPDRNGDGFYTPGYDVNTRVNDAWGIRDVVGSSVLLGSRYSATMFKPREERFRLFPPEHSHAVCTEPGRRAEGNAGETLGRYELRPAMGVSAGQPRGPESERLQGMMRNHRFGAEWPARQLGSELERHLSDPENLFGWVSALNARYDDRRMRLVTQGPGLDLREVWVVPRLHLVDGLSAELLVTPSASRWADWYVATGYDRRSERSGAPTAARGFAGEVGLKFRVAMPGRSRWAMLGYRFGGLRVGMRFNGFSRLDSGRLVVELGAGAF